MTAGEFMPDRSRNPRGSTLVLTLAIFLGFVLILALFSLSFVRTLGAHQEQETAVEAAALAAAKALSKIVIEDPGVGFVSLSNYPPTCKQTKAGDNYFTSVNSINRLLAKHRALHVSLIRPMMPQTSMVHGLCLQRDYQAIRAAQERLKTALLRSVETNSGGSDADGNFVSPYEEAVKAYEQNCIRLTGKKNHLVPGSLKITLGLANNISTNTKALMDETSMHEGDFLDKNYVAYRNIAWAGTDYVFCATGNVPTLLSPKLFKERDASLPYMLPSIVKVEATQEFVENDGSSKKVQCVACAEPPCLLDECPNRGTLTMSFPDGVPPECRTFLGTMESTQIRQCPADLIESPRSGDYPETSLTKVVLPELGSQNPPFSDVLALVQYDFMKRAAENRGVFNASFFGFSNVVNLGPQRVIYSREGPARSVPLDANSDLPVSNNQWRAVSGIALHSENGKFYDIVVKDYVYKGGRTHGGIHAGELLGTVRTASGGIAATRRIDDVTDQDGRFPTGGAQGEPRPSYYGDGIAVDVRVREVKVTAARLP